MVINNLHLWRRPYLISRCWQFLKWPHLLTAPLLTFLVHHCCTILLYHLYHFAVPFCCTIFAVPFCCTIFAAPLTAPLLLTHLMTAPLDLFNAFWVTIDGLWHKHCNICCWWPFTACYFSAVFKNEHCFMMVVKSL